MQVMWPQQQMIDGAGRLLVRDHQKEEELYGEKLPV